MDEFENGITFTDEEAAEDVKKLMQDAEDALKFENTDADAVAAEFDNVATRCKNCIKKLDELYNGGSSYETAKDTLEAFKQSDMNPMTGYIPLFAKNKANKKMFESLTPNLSPDFTKGKMLYLDAGAFNTLFYDTGAMLGDMVDLKALFAFKMAHDNLEAEGFSGKVYENLQIIFMAGELAHSRMLSSSNPSLFPLSEDYYSKYHDVLDDKQMAHTYWQFRRVDVNNFLKNDSNLTRFRNAVSGDGPFYPLWSVLSRLQIIDRYTKAISKHKDAGDEIKELTDKCSELMTSAGKLLDKIQHPSSKNVLTALGQLYTKLRGIALDALEHYNKFKDSDDAPYVFMKYPSEGFTDSWAKSVGVCPSNSGGWDGGTKYHDAMWKLADVVSNAFERVVYQHGHIKRN
ncbi:MAG: hypothetical protein IKG85_02990 [Clostridia bacterium]|nr:hypothetical protein [Clostridia bacterium]